MTNDEHTPRREWAGGLDTRDELVRNAYAAGLTVDRIDASMRIGPASIRQILGIGSEDSIQG